jgi:hypothetical protein
MDASWFSRRLNDTDGPRHNASEPIDANVRIDRLLIPLATLKNPVS